ncbi:uncharacterized protein K441DRAFT_543878, partial [Cenococcum geophilum 1.58]|uniref:uncharacterized protein n=1 Tax=Cenococcum geophilum 1.58 TaxID=794803 RepID=UPI00358E6529
KAVTNIININKFNSGTVKRIIQFIYKRDYNNSEEEQGSNIINSSGGDNKDITIRPITAYITLRHIHINAIADYYDIL